jgi:hypothetical protein
VDYIGRCCCHGIICRARDCSRYGIRHDHSHVGFSERIGFGDGDSGRVFGNPVATDDLDDESLVLFVG